MTEHFDHSDFCHCLDWKDDICPVKCFRARLTKDLKEMNPTYPWPVSYSHFKGSGDCKLNGNEIPK